jgi:hypothetical protein
MSMKKYNTSWLSIRDREDIQFSHRNPFHTRYHLNEPIINPPNYMMGQRVYRDFVLEDSCTKEMMILLIVDDHSYSQISYHNDDKENFIILFEMSY